MRPIHDHSSDLPSGLLATCTPRPFPPRALMCPPDDFDVVDVKNPHMTGQIGQVDRDLAIRQWEEVRAAIEACGVEVAEVPPLPGCEDMVFCANQTLVGLDEQGARHCLASHMTHASRRREVPAFETWFRDAGYEVTPHPPVVLEGSGDAIWHPGKGLIWGGHGIRTEAAAYETVHEVFGVPVIRLKLVSDRFYHLDTCFCPLDERTVLLDPTALEPAGVELARAVFEDVIECPPLEAAEGMACNAAAFGGRRVVIQRGNAHTVGELRQRDFEVFEVDTSEYLKSGGSVFCMKMYVY